MLTAINTKLLLAILAALTVIGGAAMYQRDEAAKAAAATARAAQLLQLQKDDNDYLKQGLFGNRLRLTRSSTILPQPMKAKPGRPTSPSPGLKPSP
jgi:type VI protein secretion system component VasK